jgi:hypothetical protein
MSDVVEESVVEGSAPGEDGSRQDRGALFTSAVEIGRVSASLKVEAEDAKSVMPIANCTGGEWCALCHWCSGRQTSTSDRCTFQRRGRKEWFLSYQGLLLLMYRLDTAMFDRIQESETASPALKRKLKFLVAVFNHPSAAITLTEVNPAYVTARYERMKSQVGFRMNASALRTLLTSFRICFNVMRIEAAQRQAAMTGQRSFERAAMRKAKFSNLRQMNLFGQKRTREEEDDGHAEMSEASSGSGGEGSATMPTAAARSKLLVSAIKHVFASYSIEIDPDEISRVLGESQGDAASASRVLEKKYWSQAVLDVGAVLEARYQRGGFFYRARIVEQQSEGKFLIEWGDEDEKDRVKMRSDFRFPRLSKAEFRRWVDREEDYEFPEFRGELNELVSCLELNVLLCLFVAHNRF